jgi:uncharacterized protein (TIGR02147 family)
MEMKWVKPDIKCYINIHDYLKDLYYFRKNTETGFSYEMWMHELGLKNRSFLRQIIVGRRSVTEETSHVIGARLNLDSVDFEYFQLLVLYSNARSTEKRNFFWGKMRQLISPRTEPVEIREVQDFVLETLHPRLQLLLGFKNAPKDVESLALLLKTSEAELQKALLKLEEMDLVQKTTAISGIQWQAKTKSFRVPGNVGSEVLLDYHQRSLEDAISARKLSANERRYRSLILALTSTEFDEFMKDFEVFVQQSLNKFDNDDFANRKLHQINFNIHAVSRVFTSAVAEVEA